jgi:arylsulfate sulfotransferase
MRDRRPVALLIAAFAFLWASSAGALGATPPPASEANFSVPTLFPNFGPYVHDYVVSCHDGPVTVKAHASQPWEIAVGAGPFRKGDFNKVVQLRSGREFTVIVRDTSGQRSYRYYVRCLPDDFPTYTFQRYGPVSPDYFSADAAFSSEQNRYAIILDNHGVPVWWYRASVEGPKVLPDGNVVWYDRKARQFEIHRLDGSLVRPLKAVGPTPVDGHDLQFLPNGDYLVGAYVVQSHVDTSPYGGSSDANVRNTELQEVSPDRKLVWDWKSQDHISLAETPQRWWQYNFEHHQPTGFGYDILHWNSIEPDGGSVIASFRHLDAVYKIDKATGAIVWKLGGTATPDSLTVKRDPESYTFGGQHDVRLLPDGTLTALDDRSYLGEPPRVVRFRIDEGAGTATLIKSISDPAAKFSYCCGSARRLSNSDWLIDWGQGSNSIGGYKPDGDRTFYLHFDSTFSYRAEPVPAGAVSADDLRKGMDAMCSSGCG